jgi:16S rRNA (adenine1518-N6/adenine1519-N6)-dimethyltransferase
MTYYSKAMDSNYIRAKKHLGQHFLKDQQVAREITEALDTAQWPRVIEVGPGMGVLTEWLLQIPGIHLHAVEIDIESVAYLERRFRENQGFIIHGDFLTLDLPGIFQEQMAIIGNFPYNISSQIFFKILENRDLVGQVVGMVQKEVGERICQGPGSRSYGILSVFLQAFYRCEYLFTVGEDLFVPPPKVKSGVIRLTRNERASLGCDEQLFFRVVKAAFNQRRKILSNALKSYGWIPPVEYALQRAEQLSVEDFIRLTLHLEREQ